MRDFLIDAFDKLVAVIVILGAIAIVGATALALYAGSANGGGILPALAILVFGTVCLILIGGGMYLGLGIYHNTRRMAEAMERR